MSRLRTFLLVVRMYRAHHPWRYAVRIAFGIAFRSLPF